MSRASKSFIAAKGLSVEELKVYFRDSVRMFQGKGKEADKSNEVKQVESLAERTAGLQLGNRKRPITDKQVRTSYLKQQFSVLSSLIHPFY
jgi:hypothetical protein